MVYLNPPYSLVLEAASAVVEVMRTLSLDSCLVGGLACKLFGTSRSPGDVDIVVLSNRYTQEELKAALVRQNRNFVRVASRDPLATYTVLWYRSTFVGRCKVDILQPGVMNIPDVPISVIQQLGGLPVAPLSLIILLKLQAWDDHRHAIAQYLVDKQHTDVSDLRSLLSLASGMSVKPRKEAWLPSTFVTKAEKRVLKYTSRIPDSANGWKELGFDVGSSTSSRSYLKPLSTNKRGSSSANATSSSRAPPRIRTDEYRRGTHSTLASLRDFQESFAKLSLDHDW